MRAAIDRPANRCIDGALTRRPMESLGRVWLTKVDTFQFSDPHELCQLKRRYVPGNQLHEGPSTSRSVVARFVDVTGHAVRDLVQQDRPLDAVPRDPNAQPVRSGDASGGGFRYCRHLWWMGSPRFRPDVIDNELRLLEGDHAAVSGVNG